MFAATAKINFTTPFITPHCLNYCYCMFLVEIVLRHFCDATARHPSICFTMEREIDKKLSFLDKLLDNSHPSIITTIFSGV